MNAQWMYPLRLRDVFDFGEEELAANRNGQITEYQRRRLLRRLLKNFAIGIPFFHCSFACRIHRYGNGFCG